MAMAKMWDGSAWVDVFGVPANGVVGTGTSRQLIQSGTFTITFASGVATGTVTYPTAYASAPIVVMWAQAITNNTSVTMNSTGVSATTAQWRAQQQATGTAYNGSVGGYWIAIGVG